MDRDAQAFQASQGARRAYPCTAEAAANRSHASSSNHIDVFSSDSESGVSGEPRSPMAASSQRASSSPSPSSSVQSGRSRKRRKGAVKKKRSFRLSCKQYSITYPQCPVPRATFDEAFKLKFRPAEYASARESHADGHFHLHLFCSYLKRLDVRSARHFDVAFEGVTYHPNIQKTKSKVAWLEYISKGDDCGGGPLDEARYSGDIHYDPLSEPLGKRKSRWEDWQWSEAFRVSRQLKAVEFPIKLECEEKKSYEMLAPDPRNKKRSWWIVAPPNAGKTLWLNRTFAGVSIYSPRTGPYPFEGYLDQDIIVYDDREGVTFAEFASVLNTWEIVTPIAGQVRYRTQNWKLGHTRSVIVLSNRTIEEVMPPDDWNRMKKRFVQIVNPKLRSAEEIEEERKEEAGEDEVEQVADAHLVQDFVSGGH